uniref:FZ domain-containing protein n=1 Tax=Hemiselmis tepida TaxID=464990 RepID=A0A7S0VQU3_9CRYP
MGARVLVAALAACVISPSIRGVGGAKTLQGIFPGNADWINGMHRTGEVMSYCPYNCTGNSDFATHVGGDPRYQKFWDFSGWLSPQYSEDTKQEIAAGLTQGPQHFIQSGVSMLCKKPYDVCDYPNGDVYVRQSLEKLITRTTDEICQQSMKVFLCALFRRKCLIPTDQDRFSPTYRNRAVQPVCWQQCWNAYHDCGYNFMHTTLMCSEYIKAGWVQYDYQGRATGCDNLAWRGRSPPPLWAALLALVLAVLPTVLLR